MDKIDSAYNVLSISHQCKLLGISRSQYYYEPSSEQDEKDFNLLMQIKEVQGLQISQEVSVSSEKQGNQISESGMVNGYHLHKAADRNVYLMAIIDWFSRKVLSWRVFNTMDTLQYANLLRETIEEYGCPAIFNTDQGSQFTSILNATKQ